MIKNRLLPLLNYLYLLIRKDIRTKGVIIIVGIILWFSINLEKDFETMVTVPIKITNLKRNRVLLNSIPKQAQIMIKGKGKELFFSDLAKNLYFEIDLANINKKKTVQINSDLFINQSSAEITLVSVVQPQMIEIEIDTYSSRRVPVVLRSFYTLKTGYLASGDISVEPDSVFVSGPVEKVQKIDRVYTEEMVDSNISKNLKYTAKLLLPDTAVVTFSSSKVNVFQKISKKGVNSFKCLVRLLNAPSDKEVIIDPVSITIEVTGPVDQLYDIDQKKFTITADYQKLNDFDKTIKIEVETDISTTWQISSEYIKVIEL